VNPKELYITGIIYYVSQCWFSYIPYDILCDKILPRYFWSTLNLAQWQAKLKEEGSSVSRKYVLATPLRSCVWPSACMWRARLRVVTLLVVKHVRAISFLLRSTITWQAQKETKEPRLIYSWLTNLCKHSPTATVLVSTAFVVLFSIRWYYLVKLWKNAWLLNDKRIITVKVEHSTG